MTNFTTFVSVWAWVGGLVSWLIAATFDYIQCAQRFRDEKQVLIGACERDEKYREEIGDINEAAANRAGGLPEFTKSLERNHSQPLLVSVITAVVSFFGTPRGGDMNWSLAIWVLLLIAVLVVASLSSPGLPTARHLNRWQVALACWMATLAVFLILARFNGAPAPEDRANPSAPVGSSGIVNR